MTDSPDLHPVTSHPETTPPQEILRYTKDLLREMKITVIDTAELDLDKVPSLMDDPNMTSEQKRTILEFVDRVESNRERPMHVDMFLETNMEKGDEVADKVTDFALGELGLGTQSACGFGTIPGEKKEYYYLKIGLVGDRDQKKLNSPGLPERT